MKPLISIVIPLYNEEKNIAMLVDEIIRHVASHGEIEFILVDDGSEDHTLSEIKKLADRDDRVFYLSFSRNFGHQNALRAGLEIATGDAVISMDGDMQHPPEVLPLMIGKWREGHEVIVTVRQTTAGLSWLKRKTSRSFYRAINVLAGIELHEGSADFRLLDRKVVEALSTMHERTIFYRGLIPWVGFKQCQLAYNPSSRLHGKSKYSVRKMVRLALDGITSFSFWPLRFAVIFGFILAFLSFLYVLYAFYVKIFTDQAISGWASVMTGIYFLGGIQLIFIGLCGEYIGRIFMEVKRRPNYLVSDKKIPEKGNNH